MSVIAPLKRVLGWGTKTPGEEDSHHHEPGETRGHGLMMIACCIPMLVIAIVLVATGVAGTGFAVAAVACTVMMAMMMGGHGRPGGGDKNDRS